MPIYQLGPKRPKIDPTAYIHPDAVIIGDVSIGAETSVWPCAVLRGDSSSIVVGAKTSIQDGAIIHTRSATPTTIGNCVTVGHNVHIEGAIIKDHALIGSGSTVLPGAIVGNGALVGAQALVSPNAIIPDYARALGVPARISEKEVEPGFSDPNVEAYLMAAKLYKTELVEIELKDAY